MMKFIPDFSPRDPTSTDGSIKTYPRVEYVGVNVSNNELSLSVKLISRLPVNKRIPLLILGDEKTLYSSNCSDNTMVFNAVERLEKSIDKGKFVSVIVTVTNRELTAC